MKEVLIKLKKVLGNYEKSTGRKIEYHKPLSNDEIQWIEKKFNLYLPENFKEFLKVIGGFSVDATEVFLTRDFEEDIDSSGNISAKRILHNGFEIYNDSMLYLTEENINKNDTEFPKSFIMFEFIDDGGYHVLDCSVPNAEDSPVYVWESAENYLDNEPLYSSFKARIEKQIETLSNKID